MNQEPNYPPIDPELEAQIVAFVLGESSDVEREKIQRLMEEQPELVQVKQHFENVHRLLRDVGRDTESGESMIEDEPWKLPAEKRERVLSVISGKTVSGPEEASWPVFLPSRLTPHLLKRVASVAAVVCMVATAGMLLVPAVNSARESAPRMSYTVDSSRADIAKGNEAAAESYDATASVSVPADGTGTVLLGGIKRGYEMELEEMTIDQADAPTASVSVPADGTGTVLLGGIKPGYEMELEEMTIDQANAPLSDLYGASLRKKMPANFDDDFDVGMDSAENQYLERDLDAPVDGKKRKAGEKPGSARSANPYGRIEFKNEEGKYVRDSDLKIKGYPARTGRIMFGGAVNSDAGVSGQITNRSRPQSQPDNRLSDSIRGVDVDRDFDGIVEGETYKEPSQDDESGDNLLGVRVAATPERLTPQAGEMGGGGGAAGVMGGGQAFLKSDLGAPLDRSGVAVEDLLDILERSETEDDYGGFAQQQGQAGASISGELNGGQFGNDQRFQRSGILPSRGRGKTPSFLKKRDSRKESTRELDASDQPFSTFSLHVSDVSFKLAQAALSRGQWPDATKIRIEEFVNAMDYGDPMPCNDEKVASRNEQAVHPFLQQRNVLRVSMRTAAAGRASKTPLRLTLLLDSSGSMERIDRRNTVRRAFESLASQLKAIDEVTLISFARTPRLLAERVGGEQAGRLVDLIENLPSEGGTNLEAAIELAFEKAKERQADDVQSRIILLTDGAVNLGDADPESLLELITAVRDEGIAFDAAGISANGLNDEVLEAMTRKGDGRYYLLDSDEDADDGFAKQIAGALRPSAKNVKVQVEFNPRRVGRYQLLGFEKHILNKEDFRNDAVDAAEMAAAESGVAVYQFEPKPDGEGDVGTVSVRFRDLSTGEMIEDRWPIPYQPAVARMENAAPSLRIATTAAMFAAGLRGEALGQSVDLKTLSDLMAGLPQEQSRSKRVTQLKQMIQQARQVRGE